jgi:hypothetical protein
MQVTFTYRDTAGDFTVDAEVSDGKKVLIVSITDDWNQDIPLDDFSDSEQYTMRSIAIREYHNVLNNDDDEDEGEDGDEAWY